VLPKTTKVITPEYREEKNMKTILRIALRNLKQKPIIRSSELGLEKKPLFEANLSGEPTN